MDPLSLSLLGPLLTGGLAGGVSLLGGQMAQESNAQNNFANMMYNSNQAEATRVYNSQQAEMSRGFSAQQLERTLGYNAQQASINRDFSAEQAQKGRDANYQNMVDTMGFNRDEAAKSRDFTSQMSSTAYQRAVADMKAAGINPMLAYMKGGADTGGSAQASSSAPGAPTASGSAASIGGPGSSAQASSGTSSMSSSPFYQNILSHAMSSAFEAMKTDPIVKGLHQDVKTKEWDTEFRRAQGRAEINRGNVLHEQTAQAKADTREANARAELRELEKNRAKQDSDYFGSKAGEWSRWIGNLGKDVGEGVNTAKGLSDMFRGR